MITQSQRSNFSQIFSKSDEYKLHESSVKEQKSETTTPLLEKSIPLPTSPQVPTGIRNRLHPKSNSKPPVMSILENPSPFDMVSSSGRGLTSLPSTPQPFNSLPYRTPAAKSSLADINDTPYLKSFQSNQKSTRIMNSNDSRIFSRSDETPVAKYHFDDSSEPITFSHYDDNSYSKSSRNNQLFENHNQIIDSNPELKNWIILLGTTKPTTSGRNGNSDTLNDNVKAILKCMGGYGEVVEYRVCDGNWMFIKYSSQNQASMAAWQSCVHIPELQIAVSVHLLTSDLAASFNFYDSVSKISSDINVPRDLIQLDETVSSQPTYRSIKDPKSRDEYLKPIKKSSSICTKILQFFFSY